LGRAKNNLGVPFTSAWLYDPMTGKSGRLARRSPGAHGQIYVQLEAGETIILRVDSKETPGPAWPYRRPCGEPIVLRGEWSVEFIDGGPELPQAYKTRNLLSWTGAADTRAKAFAGTARYTLHFTTPRGSADDWLLDLGDVRQSARVHLNGHDAGVLIAVPFATRVGSYLKPGKNTLVVEVTNLSANRIRDLELRKVDWKVMKDANIVNVNYQKFDPAQWSLEESGLLGPVKLVPEKQFSPTP
jgi:hypothetical protein